MLAGMGVQSRAANDILIGMLEHRCPPEVTPR